MKNELEKMEEYLPYKIFQKNEDNFFNQKFC